MRAVCAWCGTTISEGVPGDIRVSHGICPQCSRRYFATSLRYAVVPRDRPFLLAEIETAFQKVGGIRVILDRRRGDRRRRCRRVRDERRTSRRDRRQSPCPIVGAVPAVGGLWVPGRPMVPGHAGDFPTGEGRPIPRIHLERRPHPAGAAEPPPADMDVSRSGGSAGARPG